MNSKSQSTMREKLNDFFTKGIMAEQAKKESQKKVMVDQLKKVTTSKNIIINRAAF